MRVIGHSRGAAVEAEEEVRTGVGGGGTGLKSCIGCWFGQITDQQLLVVVVVVS